MGLSFAVRPSRSLGLLVLLAIAACAGGDRLDAPTRAAQGVGTPHWPSGSAITVAQRSAARVALSWPEATGAEAPYAYAVYRDGELTHVMPVPELTDESVAASTPYAYAIAARDAEGRESEVAERLTVTVTTPGSSPAPEWPSGAALSVSRVGRNRAELAWPSGLPVAAASDAYDECRYEVQHRESGAGTWVSDVVVKETPAEVEGALVAGLSAGTAYDFRVLLTDLEGNVSAAALASASASTASPSTPFAWPAGASASAAVVTRSSLRLTWSEGPLDTEYYELERDLGAGFVPWAIVPAGFQSARTFEGDGFFPRAAPFALRVRAVDTAGPAAWLDATATIAVPPSPAPPVLPRTEGASLADGASFLYEATGGAVPQQTGVAPGTIAATRAVVLTGRVHRHDGSTLVAAAAVRVSVLGHPEFGETWTRADGRYEMAVNGGDALVVEFAAPDHLPVQRTVTTYWGEFAHVDNVTLTAEATPVPLALDASGAVPTGGVGLVGPVVNPGAEPRRAAVFLPEGRTVTACLPGSTVDTCIPQALTGELHVSLTEFTTDDNDLAAMPGSLPPSSGYTYAVAYNIREAEALHATRVEFSGPVVAYVDNFMGLQLNGASARSGYAVPTGWYDRATGRWVANEPSAGWNDEGSGRAIEVLAVLADGRASIDVNADGVADEPPGLGLSDDERRWIAATYVPGTALPRTPTAPHALWRVPIAHFSMWDTNLNIKPEDGAKMPLLKRILGRTVERPCLTCGSVIENENRALGERIDLPGVGTSLHYHSTRSPSRRTQLVIPMTVEYAVASPPSPRPRAVVVHVFIAGKLYQHVEPGTEGGRVPAGLSWTFERCESDTPPSNAECWDGRDVFGREVRGSVPVRVAVGHQFDAVYGRTDAFGYNGGMRISVFNTTGGGGGSSFNATGIPRAARQSLLFWTEMRTVFEQWDARAQGLGGWTLPMQHAWDAYAQRVLTGDGGAFASGAVLGNGVARRLAGIERWSAFAEDPAVVDGTVAVTAGLGNGGVDTRFEPLAIALDARGQLFIGNFGGRVWRVDDAGRLRFVTQLPYAYPSAMTFGSDGALYIAENGRIWRWHTGGLTLFAGTGAEAPGGAPGRAPAIASAFGAIGGLAAAPDGALYFTEADKGRVRRIGPDGTVDTYAGDGTQSVHCTHEGGAADVDHVAARSTWLCRPQGLFMGANGVLYLTEDFAVSRITPDGLLHRVAGRRHTGPRDCSDAPPDHGMTALDACLYDPADVAVMHDGTVLIAMAHPDGPYATEGFQNGVFGVDTEGHLIHVAAGGYFQGSQDQLTRRLAEDFTQHVRDLAIDGQGRPVLLSTGSRTVWRLEGDAPDRVPTANVTVTSPDGSERYTFTRGGRILDTTDTRTGQRRYTFAYDAALRLQSVTDGFSNTLTLGYASPDAGYIPSGVATSFTLTGPHGATATGTIDAHGWLSAVDAGEWGTTALRYDGHRHPLTAMQDSLGRWHRFVYDTTGRLDYDAWATSATADLAGGRVVSLAVTSDARDVNGLHWTTRTRDGDSLSGGLDRVDAVSLRDDGVVARSTTPPVGPETARTSLRGEAGVYAGYRQVPVTGEVATGANGFAWSRSYGGEFLESVTPLDVQTRSDLRLGSATASTVRLSVTTALQLNNATTSDLWRANHITERVAVVPGADDETTLASMGAVPLHHAGTPRRWERNRYRQYDPWNNTLGWVAVAHTPLNRSTVTTLDPHGRVVEAHAPVIDQPGGAVTPLPVSVTYDARGRLWTMTQGSRQLTYAYADGTEHPVAVRGRLTSITVGTLAEGGPPPRVVSFAYNQDGARRVRVTAPGAIVTNSGVDPAGNVTSLTPPGRTEHAFSYGWRNLPDTYTPPVPAGGGATSLWQTTQQHLVQGLPQSVTRPDGEVSYTHTHGRLTAMTLPPSSAGGASPTLSFAYDEATGGGSGTGVLTSVTRTVGTATDALVYGYNFPATGTLPRSETWSVTEGGTTTTRAVSVDYNGLAQVASWTATGGPAVAITRDADDLVTGVGALAITRDGPSGVELGTSLAEGAGSVTTTQRYNTYGEVATRGSVYGGAEGLSFAYQYDWFGRLERVVESGEGAGAERWYRYDEAGRLARVCTTQDCGEGADGGASTELERYTYDANGTRSTWGNDAGSFSVAAADVDAQDRLLRYTLPGGGSVALSYDRAGRTTGRVKRDASDVQVAATTLVYDADGALRSFTRTGEGAAAVSYGTDASGRRTSRSEGGAVTARWTYRGIHPVAEYDAAWALRRVFVYATRGHVLDYVAESDGSGGWVLHRVVTDHLGSVRRVVRVSDGVVMQRMRYDAYGRVLQDEAAGGWERVPFGYAGGVYDRATGLVRFGARDYDPEIGRWTAKDPIGFNGGDGNLYGYVNADAVNYFDEDGKNPLLWGIAAFGIAMYLRNEYIDDSTWRSTTTTVGMAIAALDMTYGNMLRKLSGGPRISVTGGGHEPIVVRNSMIGACGTGARTIGNVILLGPGRENLYSHEAHHVEQARRMGPMFIPLQLAGQLYSVISAPNEHAARAAFASYSRNNPWEIGPYNGRAWAGLPVSSYLRALLHISN